MQQGKPSEKEATPIFSRKSSNFDILPVLNSQRDGKGKSKDLLQDGLFKSEEKGKLVHNFNSSSAENMESIDSMHVPLRPKH